MRSYCIYVFFNLIETYCYYYLGTSENIRCCLFLCIATRGEKNLTTFWVALCLLRLFQRLMCCGNLWVGGRLESFRQIKPKYHQSFDSIKTICFKKADTKWNSPLQTLGRCWWRTTPGAAGWWELQPCPSCPWRSGKSNSLGPSVLLT